MRRALSRWIARLALTLLLLPTAAGAEKPPDGVSAEEHAAIEQTLPASAPAKPATARRLLVVDLNVGRGGHPSIPHANLAVRLMGERTGAYETVVCHDRSMLAPERLKTFDAVFLNNTIGPLFNTPELRDGFAAFIAGGGGLAANHAVTVTSKDWPAFGEILGARGAAHRDADEKVTVRLDDPDSPLNAAFGGKPFTIADEIFRFQAPYSRGRVHVLLSVDVARTDMNQGRPRGGCIRPDNDYPISWIRRHGRGRVFYCSLGHNPYVFWDERMLHHFLAGIQFALGDLEADASPSAAPDAGRPVMEERSMGSARWVSGATAREAASQQRTEADKAPSPRATGHPPYLSSARRRGAVGTPRAGMRLAATRAEPTAPYLEEPYLNAISGLPRSAKTKARRFRDNYSLIARVYLIAGKPGFKLPDLGYAAHSK